MPSWGAQWIHVRDILSAAGSDLSRIAYVYVLPFRTKDDAGSKLPMRVIEASYAAGFGELMTTLAPGLVITMDRISEACIDRWRTGDDGSAEHFYYTRKRDAHSDRRALLDRLRARAT